MALDLSSHEIKQYDRYHDLPDSRLLQTLTRRDLEHRSAAEETRVVVRCTSITLFFVALAAGAMATTFHSGLRFVVIASAALIMANAAVLVVRYRPCRRRSWS